MTVLQPGASGRPGAKLGVWWQVRGDILNGRNKACRYAKTESENDVTIILLCKDIYGKQDVMLRDNQAVRQDFESGCAKF